MKLKEYESKTHKLENALALKKALEELKDKIAEIRNLEVGLNFCEKEQAYDLALVTEFDTVDDLEIYRLHPEHKKVLVFLHSVTSNRVVVDYQI